MQDAIEPTPPGIKRMPDMYIVGAQCTGKTTRVDAVQHYFAEQYPNLRHFVIKEIARDLLKSQNITRDEIRAGANKAATFQSSIATAQFLQETSINSKDVLISDRSGIDPIVYVSMFCQPSVAQMIMKDESWVWLRERMRSAIVIVCPPIEAWLNDDGTRLLPVDVQEWEQMHATFCRLLEHNKIPYKLIPVEIQELDQRVAFVTQAWGRINVNLE